MPTDEEIHYPVLYIRLEPKDFGFAAGYRFLVEQLDAPRTDDRHFFKDAVDKAGNVTHTARERAEAFMATHNMRPVTLQEMSNCRRALKIS